MKIFIMNCREKYENCLLCSSEKKFEEERRNFVKKIRIPSRESPTAWGQSESKNRVS